MYIFDGHIVHRDKSALGATRAGCLVVAHLEARSGCIKYQHRIIALGRSPLSSHYPRGGAQREHHVFRRNGSETR